MTAVDATLGGGGHALEILERIKPGGKLIAIDQDAKAARRFQERLNSLGKAVEKVKVQVANFSQLEAVLSSLKIESVDAILADLGLSSDQLDSPERGFSFRTEAPLDMRMDQSNPLTAREVVNSYSVERLTDIIQTLGEERFAWFVAKAIVKAREEKPIETTTDLADIIIGAIPAKYRFGKINPATKTFQALRMEVNQELTVLTSFLSQAVGKLKVGGRIAIISFHSGEDRIVKSFFRQNARGCICPSDFPVCQCGRKPTLKIVTSRPIEPSEQEVATNPRSRSAKLRVAEKI